MPLTPLEVQKMRFPQRMRGFDTVEVENFLSLVAEELAGRLGDIERLERENQYFRERLEEAERRERQLQDTMLRGQKVADEIVESAKREAHLKLREAEVTADKVVQQAIDQATRIEGKLTELRAMRRELQLKFKNTLDLFRSILEAEMDDEGNTATVRTLPRKQREA